MKDSRLPISRCYAALHGEQSTDFEAVDGGTGDGKLGDSFAFTAFFDPREAPVNHKIFGPKFTFTGKMVEGKITIIDPSR